MKRRSFRKLERNKSNKETQSDEGNSGEQDAGPSRVKVVKHGTAQTATRRIELHIQGSLHCENFNVGIDNMRVDNSIQQQFINKTPLQPSTSETEENAATRLKIASCHEDIQRLRKSLKDYIGTECCGPVTEGYDDLTEPAKEISPKLLQLLRFYEGDLLKKMMSQYQKDPPFKYGCDAISSDDELDYETFLCRVIEFGTIGISVIGQAGSGKSTIMKRLARNVAEHNEDLLIFFMNFRDLETDLHKITPCEFLFRGLCPESDVETCYKWILNNQEKVVLVMDGLDQAPWEINNKAKFIGPHGKGKTSDIVSNILKRKLFPGVKVVYSSREHAVASLKGKLRPKMVFALTGLSPGDSEWLFKSFVGENHEILWQKLRTQSHSLIPLLSIPAFLIFTAIVYVKKPENPPRSMTEVLKNLLEIFMRSGHITEEDVPTVLAGLKKMSFLGMKDGKVLFYIKNVQDAGLDPKQICDWIIRIPGLNKCNQFLLEGQYVLMFSHQTIQEFLAAQYIIEMNFKSFEEVVMEYLKDGKWSVVTRFVSGLLFNDEISMDLNTDDVEQKRNALKTMMMGEKVGSSLEWLAAISESNHNVFIRDLVHDIHLCRPNLVLGDSGAYVMASVMRHVVHLDQLNFNSCHLTSGNLQILWDNIENSSLKISKLNISGNTDMEDKGYSTLGKIVKMCAVDQLLLQACVLSYGKLKNLLSETDGAKISELDVSGNTLNESTAAVLGDIVKRCSVEELTMNNCGLNDGSLKSLLSRSSGAKLLSIDVRNFHVGKPNNLSSALLDEISRSITVEHGRY